MRLIMQMMLQQGNKMMMMSSNCSRLLAVRSFSTRASSIDWSRPVWSLSPEVAASYNKLRAWVAMSDGMYEKYNKAPPPVNFSEQKKAVRDKALVDTLEAFYKSNTPPAEIHEWSQEDKEKTDAQIAYLKELDSLHKELIPVLQEEIDFQKNNRTSKETTMFDMKVNYPLIHEEIEDELEKRQWFKDTGFDSSK